MLSKLSPSRDIKSIYVIALLIIILIHLFLYSIGCLYKLWPTNILKLMRATE